MRVGKGGLSGGEFKLLVGYHQGMISHILLISLSTSDLELYDNDLLRWNT